MLSCGKMQCDVLNHFMHDQVMPDLACLRGAKAPVHPSWQDTPLMAALSLQVKLPLEIGTRMDCKWRDGEYHPARVIERRPVEGSDQHEYYVHYSKCEPFNAPGIHCCLCVRALPLLSTQALLHIHATRAAVVHAVNRRMDEWVKQENLDLNTVDVGDIDGSDPK